MDRKRAREDDSDEEEDTRTPTTGTQAAVDMALKEAEKAKQAKRVRFEESKKAKLGPKGPPSLGKTEAEKRYEEKGKAKAVDAGPEDAPSEGKGEGPIMEGLIDVAKEQRSIRRSEGRKQAESNTSVKKLQEDTSMELGDMERFEHFEAPPDNEGDQHFEPFNLNAERDKGYFDGDGNYVEYKEEKHTADAWLQDTKVDESLAEKVRLREQAISEAPDDSLSLQQIAEKQLLIGKILHPGETVLQALKRLKGGPGAKKMDPATKAKFEELTELADSLMSAGEYEIYSDKRESLVRAAGMFAPRAATADGPPKKEKDMFADSDDEDDEPAATSGPASKKEKDMFADSDSDDEAPASTGIAKDEFQAIPVVIDVDKPFDAATGTLVSERPNTNGATNQGDPAPKPTVQDTQEATDYSTWPIGELRRYLQENGEDCKDVVEKEDLISRAKKVAAAAAAALQLDLQQLVPPGYLWNEASGYYYSAEQGLFYDTKTGGFYSSTANKWYSFDAAKCEYVPWSS